MEIARPYIGIGVMIMKDDGSVLLGQRRTSHGTGEWGFPGGHLEFGETLEECARREVEEETGLTVGDIQLISVADEMRYISEGKNHYVNIGLKAEYVGGEPLPKEEDKCDSWHWFSLEQLPEPLYEGTKLTMSHYRRGIIYT